MEADNQEICQPDNIEIEEGKIMRNSYLADKTAKGVIIFELIDNIFTEDFPVESKSRFKESAPNSRRKTGESIILLRI